MQSIFIKKKNCKNLGDYHDIYLKTDVLLLTDIFETFRKLCYKYYELDPCNYISAPGLSWDAMIKITKQPLGMIHSDEVRLFLDRCKRGGIVQAGAKRYCKANNKYIKGYRNDNLQYLFQI